MNSGTKTAQLQPKLKLLYCSTARFKFCYVQRSDIEAICPGVHKLLMVYLSQHPCQRSRPMLASEQLNRT